MTGGWLAGTGFTMVLFIANLTFSAESIDSAKPGFLLASICWAAVDFPADLGQTPGDVWRRRRDLAAKIE